MKTTVKELDEKDKRIIQLLIRRVEYKKMTHIVFLSVDGIKYRIKKMKAHYNCSTTQELISHLIDNHII